MSRRCLLRAPAPRRVRLSARAFPALLLLCGLLGLCACGGGSAPKPFEEPFPLPTPPAGGGGTTTTPPPQPPAGGAVWTPDAAVHGRVALFGAFSSDPVRRGQTLFTVDADAIEGSGARILVYDVASGAPTLSPNHATTTILGQHLRDSAGHAGDPTNPIGFGYFVNDLLVVDDTLAFVLVNAGGSDSGPTLSNVIAFDPSTGVVRQTFDLATIIAPATWPTDSTGAAVPGGAFHQAGAEAMAYQPLSATTGRLFVAMSNLVFGAPSYGAVKYPGTVQVLEVYRGLANPLVPAMLAPGQRYMFTTQAYNPIALDLVSAPPTVPGGLPQFRLLVTAAGTTGYDATYNLVPVTRSAVEVYDATDASYLGAFDLGLAGLAAVRPALGTDAAGHRVGFFPSSVTGEIYLLKLDGLYSQALDPGALAILRGPANGIPITAAQAGGPGGNVTGVALSPDGRTLVATGFGDLFQAPPVPGQLFLLALPEDLVTGAGFGVDFTPGATRFASEAGRTLGGVVLVPRGGSGPDVFVNVSGTLDANYLGTGSASLGSLDTGGLIR